MLDPPKDTAAACSVHLDREPDTRLNPLLQELEGKGSSGQTDTILPESRTTFLAMNSKSITYDGPTMTA